MDPILICSKAHNFQTFRKTSNIQDKQQRQTLWDDQLRHIGTEVPRPPRPKKVKNFKYFGCEISYKNGNDIKKQLAIFSQILGIINNTFKPNLARKISKNKSNLYNPLVLPMHLDG